MVQLSCSEVQDLEISLQANQGNPNKDAYQISDQLFSRFPVLLGLFNVGVVSDNVGRGLEVAVVHCPIKVPEY